jgi:antitoxin (DNA-binding transcriptional repressor) of toxin-antitoxin stability system
MKPVSGAVRFLVSGIAPQWLSALRLWLNTKENPLVYEQKNAAVTWLDERGIMMYWMNVQDARTHLLKLVYAVLDGEEAIIAEDGAPLARIVPYNKHEEQKLEFAPDSVTLSPQSNLVPNH